MNRIDFVDTLRTTLMLEMPQDKVEENVRYYNDYILSMGDESQQEIEIARIGDPHLIAQTIIDAYKMSEPYKYDESNSQSYTQHSDISDKEVHDKDNGVWARAKSIVTTSCVILFALVLIRVAFGLFVRIGLPLIGIYIIIRLIRRNM